MSAATRDYPKKKKNYAIRMNALLDQFKTILVVEADNVQSHQMHTVRKELRGRAEIVMGKNTLMKKIMKIRYDADPSPGNQALYDSFVLSGTLLGNVGLVLTNESPNSVFDTLSKFKVNTSARVGSIAPIEVSIPAGKTGLEPTQSLFFSKLNIPVKIEASQVTILKDIIVVRPGEKVGPSEARLMEKLKMKPFMYGLETKYVFEGGVLYPRSVVGVTDEQLFGFVQGAVDDLAALSLATGVQSLPAVSHQVVGAFKDLLSLAFAVDVSFTEFGAAEFITAVKEGKVGGGGGGDNAPAPQGAPAPSGKTAPAPVAAAAPAEEEEGVELDALF